MSDAKGEAERIGLLVRALLKRPQRLLENAAVDFDPAVAEVDKRRALLQQEANLRGRHRLARDTDGQLEIV